MTVKHKLRHADTCWSLRQEFRSQHDFQGEYLSQSNEIVWLTNRHDMDVRNERQVKERNIAKIRINGKKSRKK